MAGIKYTWLLGGAECVWIRSKNVAWIAGFDPDTVLVIICIQVRE